MEKVYVIVATNPEQYEEYSWNVSFLTDKDKAVKFITEANNKITNLHDKAQASAIRNDKFWWNTKWGREYEKYLKSINVLGPEENGYSLLKLSVEELTHA